MADENQRDIAPATVVPVIEEELIAGTRQVDTGAVRVRKEVEHIAKSIDIPLRHEVVEVTRVPAGRAVDEIPPVREEGDVLIVPVVEEEIVVQKRLVLKEEIHLRRRRVEERVTKEVTLDREHAIVERLDKQGNVTASSSSAATDDAIALPDRANLKHDRLA